MRLRLRKKSPTAVGGDEAERSPQPGCQPAAGQIEAATRRAVMARDAGLARISRVTRWLVAGVVAFSCALAVVAANGFHGSTTAQAQSSPTQTDRSRALWAPSQGPASTSAPAAVVSGAS